MMMMCNEFPSLLRRRLGEQRILIKSASRTNEKIIFQVGNISQSSQIQKNNIGHNKVSSLVKQK